MRHVNVLRLTIFLLTLTLAATALAGPRDHADGFFLRLSGGAGSTGSSLSDGTDKLEFSGSGGDLNIAIGGIVAPNLALHGTLYGWSASDPTLEFNGADVTDISGTLTAAGVGAGLTYWFMPVNMYLSGTVGSGGLELDLNGGLDGKSDRGLILDLTLGKEWWVGDSWGLGLAGGLIYHSFPDPDISENWSGTSFTLRFSATMN